MNKMDNAVYEEGANMLLNKDIKKKLEKGI